MREDLLHFIWKYKTLRFDTLHGSRCESVNIIDPGGHNQLSGPDFFNAKITINDQLWAGNVEIHVKASDWYVHRHEEDSKYNNVILHVVWEDDATIFRADGSVIPALELKQYIPKAVLDRYQRLFDNTRKHFINCENEVSTIESFLLKNWLERLFLERLESKTIYIESLLQKSNNDWQQVLFLLLLRNFGLKINADSFFSIGQAIDFSTFRRLSSEVFKTESLLFGMAGLLSDKTIVDSYFKDLLSEFEFLSTKFKLQNDGVLKPEFFKLRPSNFPTIRLSQMANLYGSNQQLFSCLMAANTLEGLRALFQVNASWYWDTHYTFGKQSKKRLKKLTSKFIDLLIINTVLPLKFCYAKFQGQEVNNQILQIMRQLKQEENTIVSNFIKLGVHANDAMSSQALLQMYNQYCTKNRCLECVVGANLLKGNA